MNYDAFFTLNLMWNNFHITIITNDYSNTFKLLLQVYVFTVLEHVSFLYMYDMIFLTYKMHKSPNFSSVLRLTGKY